jgi:hypothetical protein
MQPSRHPSTLTSQKSPTKLYHRRGPSPFGKGQRKVYEYLYACYICTGTCLCMYMLYSVIDTHAGSSHVEIVPTIPENCVQLQSTWHKTAIFLPHCFPPNPTHCLYAFNLPPRGEFDLHWLQDTHTHTHTLVYLTPENYTKVSEMSTVNSYALLPGLCIDLAFEGILRRGWVFAWAC